eukprot:12143825-Alexandrium_andersonii.AAC.1
MCKCAVQAKKDYAKVVHGNKGHRFGAPDAWVWRALVFDAKRHLDQGKMEDASLVEQHLQT